MNQVNASAVGCDILNLPEKSSKTPRKEYQADCFTPKRCLVRTPPPNQHEAENISPDVTKATFSQNDKSLDKSRKEKQQHQGKGNKRKVQDTRLTPKRTLKRTPQRTSPKEQDKQDSLESIIDDVPPPSRWEIPRTPVQVVEQVQLHLLPSTPANARGTTSTQRTPVRVKTPTHPLAHSNRATPISTRPAEVPTVSKGGRDDRDENAHNTTKDSELLQTGDGEHEEIPVRSTVMVTASPPISVSKGVSTLPGLNCTDNDLAFLQRMQTIRKYEELKAEAEQLEKARKTAAEQKEQFQHEVLKIQRDLHDMKQNYKETTSSVHLLISNTEEASFDRNAESTLENNPKASQTEEKVLTQAQLAQLRKLNQVSSAKVEKAEKELKGRLVEVERAKRQLQSKIREEEERELAEKGELQSVFEKTKQERQKWKEKVDQESDNYTTMKNKLSEAQSELERCRERSADIATCSKSESEMDRRQTEERLKRLIRRCELYIQRHQMLKEMGTS